MKKFFILIFILIFVTLSASTDKIHKRIKKYSGTNAAALIEFLNSAKGDTLKYAKFLLSNCSANDLAVLTPDFLKENIRLAIKSKDLPYANYPEEIFLHFVLPYRISQEPLQHWRTKFYKELYPKVKNVKDIEEAAIILNIWAKEQLSYKSTHGRDQAPLTSIKRGVGRCEEMMILYMAAARSVGIPVRPTSAPYWNFTNNNHAWVEIWTPEGWKYLGDNNALNDAWFTNTTKRATLIISEVFGNYNDPDVIKQKNNVTYISSIKNYTTPVRCKIKVETPKHRPAKNASVTLYATSWGGAFPMFTSQTDNNGILSVPMGRATVFVTATKKNLFGYSHLNTMQDSILTITLSKNKNIKTQFTFHFPLPEEGGVNKKKKYFFKDTFKILKENANLKREKRLLNQRHTSEFTNWYDKTFYKTSCDSDHIKNRDDFIKKATQIAGNADNFLKVFKILSKEDRKYLVNMINEWDIKELCEIPDSTAIYQMINIYHDAKHRYSNFVPDSIFIKNTIHRTWRSAIPPENGWHESFYNKIVHLASNDLQKTVKNVIRWVDRHIKIDKDFAWTYFSGSLNPNEILNMKYIPKWYRTKLINSALKDLGVPVRWDQRLEYWNGDKFVPVESDKAKKEAEEKREIVVRIFIDYKEKKAEPWGNFLISTIDEDGQLNYIDFDGDNDSLAFRAKFRPKKNKKYYIEAFVRNSNGDANFTIKTITSESQYNINLFMPKEYVDSISEIPSNDWDKILKIIDLNQNKPAIVVLRGRFSNEPETRMLNQIHNKADKFKDVNLILISQQRDNYDVMQKYPEFKIYKTDQFFSIKNYPVIILFKEGIPVFATMGYKMGIANLLLRKLK